MISSDKGNVRLKGKDLEILTDFTILTKVLLTEYDLDAVLKAVAVAFMHKNEPSDRVDLSYLKTLINNMEQEDDNNG